MKTIKVTIQSTELDKNVNSPILVQLNEVQTESQNGILDISWDGNAWSIFNEIDEMSQHAIAFKTPPCQIQNLSLNNNFKSGMMLLLFLLTIMIQTVRYEPKNMTQHNPCHELRKLA